jgi:Fe-S-cluster-containing hydrogenase component 2
MSESYKNAIEKLEAGNFCKLIIGAALKDFATIETYSYLFTHAGAQVIDISAFPHSVLCAVKGIKKAAAEDPSLIKPLIMVSINVGEDPHFRRVKLDSNQCTECLLCIPTCPSGAFSNQTGFTYEEDLCFGCANCLDYCPHAALSLESWSAFDLNAFTELFALGASALEIHLNNNLDAFEELYRNLPKLNILESFCIGGSAMSQDRLEVAAIKIIEEVTLKYGPDKEFIIQTDGESLSGSRLDNPDKDNLSIENARIVLDKVLSLQQYAQRQIFVQLAGGITDKSLAKARDRGVKVSGVAIGSYARMILRTCLESPITALRSPSASSFTPE